MVWGVGLNAPKGIPPPGFPCGGQAGQFRILQRSATKWQISLPWLPNRFPLTPAALPNRAQTSIIFSWLYTRVGDFVMGDRQRILGIDIGIASCGWGRIDLGNNEGAVLGAGSYCFNAPVVGGKSQNRFDSLTAAKRKQTALMRGNRRRAAKMKALRKLLYDAGIIPNLTSNALAEAQQCVSPRDRKPQVTAFDLRSEALKRPLTACEFAVVVGHLFSRRGFRSSAKRLNRPNEVREHSQVLAGVKAMGDYASKGYRTVGQMLAHEPIFLKRKRNRSGNYAHTVGRADIEFEIREIFREQRQRGNAFASPALVDQILQLLNRKAQPKFDYYPVGDCRFVRGMKRASKYSYSFERFRLLSKLVKLEFANNDRPNPRPIELSHALEGFGLRPTITYADLRNAWSLPSDIRFANIADSDEASKDVTSVKGECAFGTHRLRTVLGELYWQALIEKPELLDRIAYVLSFATKPSVVEAAFNDIGLEPDISLLLKEAYQQGQFDQFRKPSHISAEAARNLIPLLASGLDYTAACARTGYKQEAASIATVRLNNQVTRRAVEECLALVEALVHEHEMPHRICVELGRDVGRSADKREEIDEGIRKATARLETIRRGFEKDFNHLPNDIEFLRYRLARDQGYKCLYSGKPIPPETVESKYNSIQIDHILPRSRFGIMRDYDNLVVCLSGENANKNDLTPHEWFMETTPDQWLVFLARVEASKELRKRKRRFLLLEDLKPLEAAFMRRSLADSQFAARLVKNSILQFLQQKFPNTAFYPDVVARPARLVSWLRKGWNLDHVKYPDGARSSDDRQHAVDALVIAAMDDRTLKAAIECAKHNELSGRPRHEFSISQPWPTFSTDAERAVKEIELVARAVNTDFRGHLHGDTAYSIVGNNGAKQRIERKPIKDIRIEDIKFIKDPERNHRLVKLVRDWVEKGKPKEAIPAWKYRWPDGSVTMEPVQKIPLVVNEEPAFVPRRLRQTNKDGIEEPFATFDRSDMIRIDVFRKKNSKDIWEFYVVPIYPHQLATMQRAPDRAVVAYKSECDWIRIDGTYEFLWSLSLMSYISTISAKNEAVEGYFRGLHRGTGAAKISKHETLVKKGIKSAVGLKTLKEFRKFTVDRLGRKFEVQREVRTWRGKACT